MCLQWEGIVSGDFGGGCSRGRPDGVALPCRHIVRKLCKYRPEQASRTTAAQPTDKYVTAPWGYYTLN